MGWDPDGRSSRRERERERERPGRQGSRTLYNV